jgi:hypothetical protein
LRYQRPKDRRVPWDCRRASDKLRVANITVLRRDLCRSTLFATIADGQIISCLRRIVEFRVFESKPIDHWGGSQKLGRDRITSIFLNELYSHSHTSWFHFIWTSWGNLNREGGIANSFLRILNFDRPCQWSHRCLLNSNVFFPLNHLWKSHSVPYSIQRDLDSSSHSAQIPTLPHLQCVFPYLRTNSGLKIQSVVMVVQ